MRYGQRVLATEPTFDEVVGHHLVAAEEWLALALLQCSVGVGGYSTEELERLRVLRREHLRVRRTFAIPFLLRQSSRRQYLRRQRLVLLRRLALRLLVLRCLRLLTRRSLRGLQLLLLRISELLCIIH